MEDRDHINQELQTQDTASHMKGRALNSLLLTLIYIVLAALLIASTKLFDL